LKRLSATSIPLFIGTLRYKIINFIAHFDHSFVSQRTGSELYVGAQRFQHGDLLEYQGRQCVLEVALQLYGVRLTGIHLQNKHR
jgi:hypothetical protein